VEVGVIETLEARALSAFYDDDRAELTRCVVALLPGERRRLSEACDAIQGAIDAIEMRDSLPIRTRHDFEGDGLWCVRRGCHQVQGAEVHA
jgi:hypothetical protein